MFTIKRTMAEDNDCYTSYTFCLNKMSADTINKYQTLIKLQSKKNGFNKSQTLNQIIREWLEGKELTLELKTKP